MSQDNLRGSRARSSHWQSWEHLQGHYNCMSKLSWKYSCPWW